MELGKFFSLGKKKCHWRPRAELYNTECGEKFFDSTESGNPVTDWLSYCPYCGKPVKVTDN